MQNVKEEQVGIQVFDCYADTQDLYDFWMRLQIAILSARYSSFLVYTIGAICRDGLFFQR